VTAGTAELVIENDWQTDSLGVLAETLPPTANTIGGTCGGVQTSIYPHDMELPI
jgi:hypothetical protein